MNCKEARKELNEYRYKRLRMEQLKEKIDSLELICYHPTSSIIVPPLNENETKGENKLVKLLDLKDQYLQLYLQAELICKKIDHKIGLLDDPFKTILRYRYCKLNTTNEIAYITHYSIDHIKRLLSQGVSKYNEIV